MGKLLAPLALTVYVIVILCMGSYLDKASHAQEQKIHALEIQLDGLRQMIAAGIEIPVYDGVPIKRRKKTKW